MLSSKESVLKLLWKHAKSIKKFLCISLLENQTPYELHVFRIFQEEFAQVFLKYCEFCESDLVHLCQETEETKLKLQRKRILHPTHPFCSHNGRRSASILGLNTILLRCIPSVVALSKSLSTIQNQQV